MRSMTSPPRCSMPRSELPVRRGSRPRVRAAARSSESKSRSRTFGRGSRRSSFSSGRDSADRRKQRRRRVRACLAQQRPSESSAERHAGDLRRELRERDRGSHGAWRGGASARPSCCTRRGSAEVAARGARRGRGLGLHAPIRQTPRQPESGPGTGDRAGESSDDERPGGRWPDAEQAADDQRAHRGTDEQAEHGSERSKRSGEYIAHKFIVGFTQDVVNGGESQPSMRSSGVAARGARRGRRRVAASRACRSGNEEVRQ